MLIPESLVKKVSEWLGEEGHEFFNMCLEKHGKISPTWSMDIGNGQRFPYSVHFNEGMDVRNFLRSCDECKGWEAKEEHAFDNNWETIVEAAIKYGDKKCVSKKQCIWSSVLSLICKVKGILFKKENVEA